jgi:hypothetical protein
MREGAPTERGGQGHLGERVINAYGGLGGYGGGLRASAGCSSTNSAAVDGGDRVTGLSPIRRARTHASPDATFIDRHGRPGDAY